MTNRKFHKTIVQIEILSEDPIGNVTDLDTIHFEITEGSWSGSTKILSESKLNGQEVAEALFKQGSDPAFFQLDEKGNDIEE